MPEYFYFGAIWAIKEHDKIIEISGGLPGINNQNRIESVLGFIQDDSYYPEMADKLTHIVHSFAKDHAFNDGNKRSAIAIGAYFLKVNGFDNLVGKFIEEMEDIVLCVADGIISKEQLLTINTNLIKMGELDEADKILLIESLEEYLRREEERRANPGA